MKDRELESRDRPLALWQQRSSRPLSEEDFRVITENVRGFFCVLAEWRKACAETSGPKVEAADATAENEELAEVAPPTAHTKRIGKRADL